MAPEATRIASERRRCSPPEMSESCFSTSSPEKRKPPSRARAFWPGQLGLALRGVEHGALAGGGVGVLGEVAELDVVAGADDPGGGLAPPGQGLDQRRLAAAVGADEDHVLAALDLELGVVEERAAGHLDLAVDQFQHDPAGPLGRLEGEAQLAACRAVRRPGPRSSSARSV